MARLPLAPPLTLEEIMNPFNDLRVTIHLDKSGNLCGIKGSRIPSKFHCDGECCNQIYGAIIISIEKFQQLKKVIKIGIDEGVINHLPQCLNTGMDEEPTICSRNCLIGLTLEDK